MENQTWRKILILIFDNSGKRIPNEFNANVNPMESNTNLQFLTQQNKMDFLNEIIEPLSKLQLQC